MRFLSLFALLLLSPVVVAETSLWEVSRGENRLFLGGTVHVLSPEDYPLPVEYDQAYELAQRLVFETNIEEVSSIAFQQSMLAAMVYTDGRTLRSELKAETYRELQAYCERVGFPLENIQSMKPGMASLVLTFYELGRLGMADTGVDSFYHRKALKDGKALGQLETAEQQLQFITSMGVGQEDALILSTVRDMQELPAIMGELTSAWRSGDGAALVKWGILPLQQDFPLLYDTLLVSRNQAWLPQIEAMLANQETELVLVGALHLVGEDGLLELLQGRGYSVKSFATD